MSASSSSKGLSSQPHTDGTGPVRLRPLAVTVHYQRGCLASHLALKITVPVSWESRSCREALVEPFMNAYAKKRPDATAQLLAGPFELLRVESWGGPRPCAADRSEQRPNGNAASQHLLLPVEEAVCVLHDVARISQHAWDKDAIEVEILAASSTALALRQTPSHALVGVGERLNRMLSDPEAELGAMHALVDAALEQGEQAYRGLALARDERGRTPLHNGVTRGDLTLCRKLMATREVPLGLGLGLPPSTRDTLTLTLTLTLTSRGRAGRRQQPGQRAHDRGARWPAADRARAGARGGGGAALAAREEPRPDVASAARVRRRGAGQRRGGPG